MSHKATNWALQRRGLKPATKIVLWHLCDRYNPDHGCFPSQENLAHDCEMSRSTLNVHLADLEARGLIRRVRRLDPTTKRQKSTRYILGFEDEFAQDTESRVRKSDAGAVSGNQPDPCPENGEFRVRNPDTNLVREPLREPVSIPRDARACAVSQPKSVEAEFDMVWEHYPRKVGKGAARKEWAKARRKAGFDEIAGPLGQFIRAMARTPTDKIPHFRTWLCQERWQDEQSHAANAPPTASQQADAIMGSPQPSEHDRLMAGFDRRLIN